MDQDVGGGRGRVREVVLAEEESGNGRLAGAGRTDKSDDGSLRDGERDTVETLVVESGGEREGDVAKFDLESLVVAVLLLSGDEVGDTRSVSMVDGRGPFDLRSDPTLGTDRIQETGDVGQNVDD